MFENKTTFNTCFAVYSTWAENKQQQQQQGSTILFSKGVINAADVCIVAGEHLEFVNNLQL